MGKPGFGTRGGGGGCGSTKKEGLFFKWIKKRGKYCSTAYDLSWELILDERGPKKGNRWAVFFGKGGGKHYGMV